MWHRRIGYYFQNNFIFWNFFLKHTILSQNSNFYLHATFFPFFFNLLFIYLFIYFHLILNVWNSHLLIMLNPRILPINSLVNTQRKLFIWHKINNAHIKHPQSQNFQPLICSLCTVVFFRLEIINLCYFVDLVKFDPQYIP